MLEQLSHEQITDIMNDYYNQTLSLKQVLIKHNLPPTYTKIYKEFPCWVRENIICPYCNIPMTSQRVSRTTAKIQGYTYSDDAVCTNCGHRYFATHFNKCDCVNCNNKREIDYQQQLVAAKKWMHKLNEEYGKPFDDICFADKVLLGAIMTMQQDNETGIVPEDKLPRQFPPLCPLLSYSDACKHLFLVGALCIDADRTPLSAVDFEDNMPKTLWIDRAYFMCNLGPDTPSTWYLQSYFDPSHLDEAVDLWTSTAMDECIEYLKMLVERMRISGDINVTSKTKNTLSMMLKHLSTGQMFYALYKAVDYCARMYTEGHMRKNSIPASIVTTAATQTARRLANNWTIYSYSRTRKNPQSIFSAYFYNTVLHIGDDGFLCPPSAQKILDVYTKLVNSEEK